jgi:hypothetical protein
MASAIVGIAVALLTSIGSSDAKDPAEFTIDSSKSPKTIDIRSPIGD